MGFGQFVLGGLKKSGLKRYRIHKEFGIWWFWDREKERVVTWSPSLEWCLRNGEKELRKNG